MNSPIFKDTQDSRVRAEGEFWTPPAWARKAQDLITAAMPEDYWENTIVYDPCCGVGRLTAGLDGVAAGIVLSTLLSQDLDKIESPNAVKFQLDFLNDTVPQPVKEYLKGAANVLFLLNPPYVRPGSISNRWETTLTENVTDTKVKKEMGSLPGRHQAYIQFIFKCVSLAEELGLKSYEIGIFSPISYLHRPQLKRFRDWLRHRVYRVDGFAFSASAFVALTTPWTLYFTLFKSGKCQSHPSVIRYNFKTGASEVHMNNEEVILSVHEDKKHLLAPKLQEKTKNAEKFSSDFSIGSISNIQEAESVIYPDSYFNLTGASQFTLQNRESLILTSGPVSNPGSVAAMRETLPYAIWLFCAVRVPGIDYLGEKEEVEIPSAISAEWLANAAVWAGFNKQCNTSSMIVNSTRLYNHMFWLTKKEVESLAPALIFDEGHWLCESNIGYSPQDTPLLAKIIQAARDKNLLWLETEEMLAKATLLWRESVTHRLIFSPYTRDPTQAYRWDAGYAQCRRIMHGLPGGQDFLRRIKWRVRCKLARALIEQKCFGPATGGIFRRSGYGI